MLVFEREVPGNNNENTSANGVWWSGSAVAALGLVHYAMIRFKEMIKEWEYSD